MVAEQQDSRTIELGALAWVVKARWDHRLGMDLDIGVHRPMPRPSGGQMTADIALHNAETYMPVVVFEVIDEDRDFSEVRAKLADLLESVKILAAIDKSGAGPAEVGVLAPQRLKEQGERIVNEAGADVMEVW